MIPALRPLIDPIEMGQQRLPLVSGTSDRFGA
jgi:hypothetical protein